MRPFKRRSAYIVLSIIIIIAGAVFIGVGFAQGGSIAYMSLNKKSTSWWPFNASAGLAINGQNAGLIIVDDKESIDGRYEEKIEKIHDLTLDLDKVDAYVQIGDENKIIFENIMASEWKLEINGNQVNLKTDIDRLLSKAKIVIEVKANEVKNLDVQLALGNLEIHDQELEEMDLNCDLGNISLYNTKAGYVNASADAGNIEGDNVALQNAKLDVDAGNITLQGVLTGKTEASSNLGRVALNLKGKVSDYGYKISCKLGNVTYDGEKHSGSNNLENRLDAKNILDLENDLGDIEVSFHD